MLPPTQTCIINEYLYVNRSSGQLDHTHYKLIHVGVWCMGLLAAGSSMATMSNLSAAGGIDQAGDMDMYHTCRIIDGPQKGVFNTCKSLRIEGRAM